jgi:hypothetical protein
MSDRDLEHLVTSIHEIAAVVENDTDFAAATFAWLIDGMFQMQFTVTFLVASGDMQFKPMIDQVLQLKQKIAAEIDRRAARWEEK